MAASITMTRGDTRIIPMQINDSAGAAVDLTGMAVRWWLAKSVRATAYALQLSIGSGVTIVNAAGGRLDVIITAAQSAVLEGQYYFELELTSGSQVFTPADTKGTLTVVADLIRP